MRIITSLLLAFVVAEGVVHAQGTFQNLAFESAAVPDLPANQSGGFVRIGSGMPAWGGFIGANPVTQILHNDVTLGSSAIAILGPDFAFGRIEANYTSLLIAGSGGDVSITQTGVLPANSKSITFKAVPGNGSFNVSLDGSLIPVVTLQITPNYTLYGGDVAAFAGQTKELKFTADSIFSQGGGLNTFYLDSIFFSPQPIPEPAVLSLFSVGLLFFGWRSFSMRR